MRDDRVDPRVRRTQAAVAEAAGRLLLDRGWDHVTHANVAEEAGYAKATLYKHWPQPIDLLRAAFERVAEVQHAPITGDLRTDLVAELEVFRQILMDEGLDKGLMALSDRAFIDVTIAGVRDRFLSQGQARLVEILQRARDAGELRGDVTIAPIADMLSGSVAYRVAICGEPVGIGFVETVVDTFLAGAASIEGDPIS